MDEADELKFLSSLAQDFIEDRDDVSCRLPSAEFLSSLAQDFIEDQWRATQRAEPPDS